MAINILDRAREYLINFLHGKQNRFETRHPWRKDWQFAVLHSLRVEAYALKILAREQHHLSDSDILLLRIASVLHDIARLEITHNHAKMGAEIVEKWIHGNSDHNLKSSDIARVLEMIADHSNKGVPEQDFGKAVLKDADTLDEIGAMSIFMASDWLKIQSPFFFHDLRQRLIEFEIPFCDKRLAILNTDGAKEILGEKRAFLENFIAQLTDELPGDGHIERMLAELSKNTI